MPEKALYKFKYAFVSDEAELCVGYNEVEASSYAEASALSEKDAKEFCDKCGYGFRGIQDCDIEE